MNFDNLKKIAEKLPKELKANAQALIARMEEVVEGIGDDPIRWKPLTLKLVQGTTDRSSIPKGTAIGDFILGEQKLEQPMKFIPLRIWEGRQYWSPDQNESRLICSSPDGKLGYIGNYCNQCPHAKFDEVARKSECGKTQNVLAIFPDLSDVFMVSFAKTNYKTGMDLKQNATKAGVHLYRRVYGLSSDTNSQYKNVENYSLEILGADERITPDPLVEFLKELFDLVTEDRREGVDKFHELVLARREMAALAAPEQSTQNVVLLTSDETTGENQPSPEVSELAKNYQV